MSSLMKLKRYREMALHPYKFRDYSPLLEQCTSDWTVSLYCNFLRLS